MKKLFVLLSSLLFIIMFQNCSIFSSFNIESPDIKLTERIDSVNIAVMPFSKQGPFLPSFSGSLFAEKLSDELFLAKDYFIVDKSKIKEAFIELEIKNPTNLTFSEINKLGSRLNAKYIITGRIQQYSNTELIGMEAEYKINVACRIISTDTGEVVGIITMLGKSKKVNVIDVLDSIAKKIVSGLNDGC
ncbi:MAG: hypothetical protein WAR79_00190 [Melioribacteraceae bacterium]